MSEQKTAAEIADQIISDSFPNCGGCNGCIAAQEAIESILESERYQARADVAELVEALRQTKLELGNYASQLTLVTKWKTQLEKSLTRIITVTDGRSLTWPEIDEIARAALAKHSRK